MTRIYTATVAAISSASATWIHELDIWLRIGAAAAAIVASVYAVRLSRSNMRRNNDQSRLCIECRTGHPPARCPVPSEERPQDCPNPKL